MSSTSGQPRPCENTAVATTAVLTATMPTATRTDRNCAASAAANTSRMGVTPWLPASSTVAAPQTTASAAKTAGFTRRGPRSAVGTATIAAR